MTEPRVEVATSLDHNTHHTEFVDAEKFGYWDNRPEIEEAPDTAASAGISHFLFPVCPVPGAFVPLLLSFVPLLSFVQTLSAASGDTLSASVVAAAAGNPIPVDTPPSPADTPSHFASDTRQNLSHFASAFALYALRPLWPSHSSYNARIPLPQDPPVSEVMAVWKCLRPLDY